MVILTWNSLSAKFPENTLSHNIHWYCNIKLHILQKKILTLFPIPNINFLNDAELQKTSLCCYQDAAATLNSLSELPTSWTIYIHIISQLTPQPSLPQAPPEDIPSLVGGVFHMLAEGPPQWRFYCRGLSHIPYVQQLHIPTAKNVRFWRVSNPCGQRLLCHGSCRGCVWLKSSANWGRRRRRRRRQGGWHLMQKVCMQFVKHPCPLPPYTSLLRKLCVCVFE